jgi:hypothetical protein
VSRHAVARGRVLGGLIALVCVTACVRSPRAEEAPAARASVVDAAAFAPPARGAVPVTGGGYHNETSVAINPTRPENVIVAYQVPATVAASFDGGGSWSAAPLPDVGRWQLAGDPVVTFDGDGRAYAIYIAFDRPEDYDTLGKAAHRNGIFVNRSDDGGRTWRARPTAVIEQPERPGVPFEDKPWMVTDRSTDTSRRGNLYVAWSQFRRTETVILFSRSTDGGRSFSAPLTISDRAGSPKDTVGAAEGTDVAVAPDGTVWVVWTDSTGILLDRSTDQGRTFGRDMHVARTADIVFAVPGVSRANGYPSLEIDARTGRMYVLWVDRRSGVAAPYLVTSVDAGRSWSPPRGIAPADSADRFFAWLSVDPVTGLAVVGQYRQRSADAIDYELAYSTDGGASFATRTWTRAPFAPAGQFLGDYTGIDAFGGVVMSAWTEALVRPDSMRVSPSVRAAPFSRAVAGRALFLPR